MYIVREVMHCKPGKVREMVKKFEGLSGVMQKMGFKPFRVLTDVTGAPYWTVLAESEADNLGDLFATVEKVMANEEARTIMAGYHDLVVSGRREIYKVEG